MTARLDDAPGYAHLPTTGIKHDTNKPRWSLLPEQGLRGVIRVLEFGARKYAPGNWKHVEDARTRYYDAALRHIIDEWYEGNVRRDAESGEHPLDHAICCLLFLRALDRKETP